MDARRLEEARREGRQQRDQAKRTEREDVGKLDAHAFLWRNLGGSSSSSQSASDGDDEEQDASGLATGGGRKKELAAEEGGSTGGIPSSPRSAEELGAREGNNESRDAGTGWACERCTFWNELGAGAGGDGADGVDPPRCEVCEEEGPRNAASPWLRA